MKLLRANTTVAPSGRETFSWISPGLLWMLSAVGTGSVLFTPRVASAYEYSFLWLLVLFVFFMGVMIREMARYSIVTGRTMMEGMHRIKGPDNWAVWFIFVPQLFAAAIGIAGLSAVVGSAVASFFPGSNTIYAVTSVVFCTAFTVTGRYGKIEQLSRVMALALMAMAIVAASVVFPGFAPLVDGLSPSWPTHSDNYILLPWIGTILAGSMGIVWFGYWTATRGFAGGLINKGDDDEGDERERASDEDKIPTLKKWISTMTLTAAVGVFGGFIVLLSFMVLGAELLAPEQLMPEGPDVAVDLARLFSGVWGDAGAYLLLVSVIIAIGGSVLANQDGWGRSFADMTMILLNKGDDSADNNPQHLTLGRWQLNRTRLKKAYIATITGVIPVIIIVIFKDPVEIMSVSGIIAAAHTPFIAGVALLVNRTQLPDSLAPGHISSFFMAMSALAYFAFAILYLKDLVT